MRSIGLTIYTRWAWSWNLWLRKVYLSSQLRYTFSWSNQKRKESYDCRFYSVHLIRERIKRGPYIPSASSLFNTDDWMTPRSAFAAYNDSSEYEKSTRRETITQLGGARWSLYFRSWRRNNAQYMLIATCNHPTNPLCKTAENCPKSAWSFENFVDGCI